MTDEETQRMADLTRRLADTAIDYKQRCEELEAKLAAERERGFWLGRSCGGSKAEIDAALAAIREGGE